MSPTLGLQFTDRSFSFGAVMRMAGGNGGMAGSGIAGMAGAFAMRPTSRVARCEDDRLHGIEDGRQTDVAWQIDSEGERLSRQICGSEDGRLGEGSLSGSGSEDD